MNEPRFEMVKATNKGDNPPEYLRDVTLAEIFAYYFNWHTDEATATEAQVKKWYLEAKGWDWEAI
jgi:hypothetical protein